MWIVVATVRSLSGHPVSAQVVNFKLLGLPGSTLGSRRGRTDKKGAARVSVTVAAGKAALVEAITNHATLVRGVTLTD